VIKYTETPIIELRTPFFKEKSLRVLVKREDLNHPHISGNKWWKLKYNLKAALDEGHDTLLTFGGAFSNHIFSTAAAAKELGLKSVGIIRGEETLPLNATLSFARECGMQLHYVSREAYRHKTEEDFLTELKNRFGKFYMIPEGGTNELAVKGCAEFANNLGREVEFDYLCLAAGTGSTMTGMMEGSHESKSIIGFPVLKGGDFLKDEIVKYTTKPNWQLDHRLSFWWLCKNNTRAFSIHE
jgi:1-aminocyclopropane-1-carboxylate deaminase